ncbi:MAG: hypothetical protein WBL40_03460 [Terrimicrobiaceae bacterium]
MQGSESRRILIASVMEEYSRDAWFEIIERCEHAGVDGFELNFSCPHGLPERKMGSAMGEDPEILLEMSNWVTSATGRPVLAKMTPNITRIEDPARAALKAGCQGVSAINTIRCVIGINLETLRPEPTVEGSTTPGGYSSNFESLDDFRGHSLKYFTTHAELVRIQKERKAAPRVSEQARFINADGDWSGDRFVEQTSALSR